MLACIQVLRFERKNTFLGWTDFVFIICSKKLSGHYKIWGYPKKYGEALLPNAPRGYGPERMPQKAGTYSSEDAGVLNISNMPQALCAQG